MYDGLDVEQPTAYDTFFNTFFGDQARANDTRSPDYTYYDVSNYDRLTLEEKDLPPYMRDICKVGLHYLACAVQDLADREVAFLRHQRVDILYVMLAYSEPLTQESFEDGYIIHYYDNPLQPAISPAWSDQNVLGGSSRLSAAVRSQRVLSAEQFARRKGLAREALTIDPQAALEERYAPENRHPAQDEVDAALGASAEAAAEFSKEAARDRLHHGSASGADVPSAAPHESADCLPMKTLKALAAWATRCCEGSPLR